MIKKANRRFGREDLSALIVASCAVFGPGVAWAQSAQQPSIGVSSKPVVTVDSYRFRDANGSGSLEPYEDWRLPVEARVRDLVGRMTLQEKAGLMLIDTLNAGCAGGLSDTKASHFVQVERMSHFILRNVVDQPGDPCDGSVAASRGGYKVTPRQMADFTNAMQALAERERLGIPVLFKDNARNHREIAPRFGISAGAGGFTEFPKEAGLAAAVLGTGDMTPVKTLTEVMSAEWRAIGLRGIYGYPADLGTEPRWYRVHETFTEDADLNARIMTELVKGLQGGPLTPRSAVSLTMKHFPGGGPQEQGLDPHYTFGKRQVYPAGRFAEHVKPFKAAIDAGLETIMPYYGVPVGLKFDGMAFDETGFAFSKQMITDLLRDKLGFKGYVNSDTGIINDRAWGLESKSVPERVATAINGGIDLLSGFNVNKTITDLVAAGLVPETRIDQAASRVLAEQFKLGLFENPYVDAALAAGAIGTAEHKAAALTVQKQSVVLLQNRPATPGSARLWPIATGSRIYTLGGLDKAEVERSGYVVTDGNAPAGRRPSAAGHQAALIRVQVTNVNTRSYRSQDPASGANPAHINPRTGKTWGAEDSCVVNPADNPVCLDDNPDARGQTEGLRYGGALPWEADALSFTAMANAKSWRISPSLADIQAVMKEVGAERTMLIVYFRNPYVLDDASGLKDAGAILAEFSVGVPALMEVISGKFKPQGKMPFALANNLQAVIDNDPDAPGYPSKDTLFPFGFGLSE